MKDAISVIGDTKINRDALIRLYTARLNNKVNVVIDDHEVKVETILKQIGWTSGQPINPFLEEEIKRFSKEAYQLTAGQLIDLGNDTVGSTMNTLDKAFKDFIRPEAPPRYIAKEIVLETPLYKDQKLEGMWNTLTDNEQMRMEQTIRLGLSKGDNEDKIIKEVMKTFKLTRSHATGVVVTSTTSVYNQVDHQVYVANKAYLDGYQYISILDSRTTLICTHLDGRIFPLSDLSHRPPQHFYCRSSTLPVPKGWDKLRNLDAVKNIRAQNTATLSEAEIEKYDIKAAHNFTGNTYEKMSYNDWLKLQPAKVQLIHLGDVQKLRMFQQGQLLVDKFSTPKGASIGLKELKMLTVQEGTANTMGASVEGTSRTFELAKERLDSLNLGFTSPTELINNPEAFDNLVEYYKLQSGDLNGQLSLTNYRGVLPHVKKATKNRVLTAPPTEEQLIYNPVTKRREDARIYAPNKAANERAINLVTNSEVLTAGDKEFILKLKDTLTDKVGVNESAVVTDNIRVTFERFRRSGDKPWLNLKAILNSEMNNSLTNVSEYIETNLRNNTDFFYKIKQEAFLDPVLGAVQLEDLAKNFHANISERNLWEIRKLPTIARELKPWINTGIPLKLQVRMDKVALDNFYMKFARKLALDNAPDRDQLAVSLGRDLYTMANYRGSKKEWFDAGAYLLEKAQKSGFYDLETFGVKKRRMRSRMSGQYFGQYYDTFSQNIIIKDARIKRYSYLNRAIDVGYRIGVNDELGNALVVRPGYKTYFIKGKSGFFTDSKIPITSSSSFADLPTTLVDETMADSLNWYSQSQYKIDPEFHSFIDNMINFRDDRGNAQYYNDLNAYKEYITGRSDSYERFKMMEYFKEKDMSFSNHAFIDHRGRTYDSGFIGPQSGETFRPFLNTPMAKKLGVDGYHNIVDQVGAFLGGLSDEFEGQFNGLNQTGRVKIFEKYKPELINIGNAIMKNKPNDIRFVLDHPMMLEIDPEDQGKFLRFALEIAKIDKYLGSNYRDLTKLDDYLISVALEQDASSSGAQIIALTTKNKQLAELSNVVPTSQKRRLYDEIAAATYDDPDFKRLNERLNLSLKDLRKASKMHNMVTLYGAGQRTASLNVERKLAKALGKDDTILVVSTKERDTVLSEISARAAKVARWDPETAQDLMGLRKQVKDIFDKGLSPDSDLMEELWWLDPKSKDFVEKLSRDYRDIITPADFGLIGKLMTKKMEERVPILNDFTKFFGRLAQDFLENAKPAQGEFDWTGLMKKKAFGVYKGGYRINPILGKMLGVDPKIPLLEQVLNKIPGFNPNSTIADIILGVRSPDYRPTGKKLGVKLAIGDVYKNIDIATLGIPAAKGRKNWTQVPWVNFDGKVLEQVYTQRYEERLYYRDADGNVITNIVQVDQKTEPTWFEELTNKDGKVNDIADSTAARTAFAVNGNHSNDAVLVKKFNNWGKKNNIGTTTVHDAFVTNAADMLKAKEALRGIYAGVLEANSVKATLDLLRERGLPKALYDQYLEEAIEKGIIPVVGKSRIGNKILTDQDILKVKDILKEVPKEFWKHNEGFYGIG